MFCSLLAFIDLDCYSISDFFFLKYSSTFFLYFSCSFFFSCSYAYFFSSIYFRLAYNLDKASWYSILRRSINFCYFYRRFWRCSFIYYLVLLSCSFLSSWYLTVWCLRVSALTLYLFYCSCFSILYWSASDLFLLMRSFCTRVLLLLPTLLCPASTASRASSSQYATSSASIFNRGSVPAMPSLIPRLKGTCMWNYTLFGDVSFYILGKYADFLGIRYPPV